MAKDNQIQGSTIDNDECIPYAVGKLKRRQKSAASKVVEAIKEKQKEARIANRPPPKHAKASVIHQSASSSLTGAKTKGSTAENVGGVVETCMAKKKTNKRKRPLANTQMQMQVNSPAVWISALKD
jgi:hypothetical protein